MGDAAQDAAIPTASARAAPRDLSGLFAPDSIAVVGASRDASKWGGDLAARLARLERERPLYFVNRRGGRLHGRPVYVSLRDLPEAPDLVLLAVPAGAFEETLDDALAMGARAVVGIFAGLGETGPEGKRREAAAAARARVAGCVLLGPNCMGLADTEALLQAVAFLDVPEGALAFVSQSGGLGEETVARALGYGIGFSRYVTLGNQADLTAADVLESLVDHASTRVVAVYVEELHDGRRFARAARAVVAAGRPVVLLAPGRSAASVRSASTHTGSLAPDATVLDAVCREAGVVRVSTPGELFHVAVGLLPRRRARGRRIAVVSDGGGHGALACDAATEAGLSVGPLEPTTLRAVHEALPSSVGQNPIDFAIGTIAPDAYGRAIDVLVDAPDVDAVLAAGQLGYWSARFPELHHNVAIELEGAEHVACAARESGAPVLVCSSYPTSPAVLELRRGGVPVFDEIESAVRALRAVVTWSEADQRMRAVLAGERTDPLAPVVEANGTTRPGREGSSLRRHEEVEGGAGRPTRVCDYWAARRTLAAAGLTYPAARRVGSAEEAAAAAEALGVPVALKAVGPLHKSDAGAVVLGLEDRGAVARAAEDMLVRLAVPALVVEAMAPVDAGVELLVGCRRDRDFGPMLLVGIGGLYAEILGDVVMTPAPADAGHVEELLLGLRGAGLLTGARGRTALDLAAAAAAAAALSRFAATEPEVAEVEVNPLLVTAAGALALDARLVWAASE
jgi:acyl-CoA synthetase (NDP forming)